MSGFWHLADRTKRRLFNRLRNAFHRIDYLSLSYDEYSRSIEKIYDDIIDEWKQIESELSRSPPRVVKRLRGFLFETLFYYSCLKVECIFKNAELLEMAGLKFKEHPPWFEATPLYDIVPMLHHLKEDGKTVRKSPQTLADFLVTYVDDLGPHPPSLIDVKSKKPGRWSDSWEWCYIAAMRRGFIFQIAYPREEKCLPRGLEEWEVITPCPNCKNFSKNYRICQYCGQVIYPYTIVDAIYGIREALSKITSLKNGESTGKK